MKKSLKILVSVLISFILISASGLFFLSRGLDKNIELNGIDLTNINDGIYNGNYKEGRWTNTLSIAIKDNKITDIDIVEDVTFSKEGVSKELFEKVKESQNTDVDVVSGATLTSRAYLKSIENAINNN